MLCNFLVPVQFLHIDGQRQHGFERSCENGKTLGLLIFKTLGVGENPLLKLPLVACRRDGDQK